jgi:hypothetical protein
VRVDGDLRAGRLRPQAYLHAFSATASYSSKRVKSRNMREMPHGIGWNIEGSCQFSQSERNGAGVLRIPCFDFLGKVRAEPLEARTKISSYTLRPPWKGRDFHWPPCLPAGYRAPNFLPNAGLAANVTSKMPSIPFYPSHFGISNLSSSTMEARTIRSRSCANMRHRIVGS